MLGLGLAGMVGWSWSLRKQVKVGRVAKVVQKPVEIVEQPTKAKTAPEAWRSGYSKNQAIMTVGEEKIFGSDFEAESKDPFYQSAVSDKKEAVLAKLANDSIILQLAREESWAGWVEEVFDKEQKDYTKRKETVFRAEEFLKKKSKDKYSQMMTSKRLAVTITRSNEASN